MSFLDDLDVEEMADGHLDHTGHNVQIDWAHPREGDGKVQAYCLDCSWNTWGKDWHRGP